MAADAVLNTILRDAASRLLGMTVPCLDAVVSHRIFAEIGNYFPRFRSNTLTKLQFLENNPIP
jgi:hypothetical protein